MFCPPRTAPRFVGSLLWPSFPSSGNSKHTESTCGHAGISAGAAAGIAAGGGMSSPVRTGASISIIIGVCPPVCGSAWWHPRHFPDARLAKAHAFRGEMPPNTRDATAGQRLSGKRHPAVPRRYSNRYLPGRFRAHLEVLRELVDVLRRDAREQRRLPDAVLPDRPSASADRPNACVRSFI